MVRNLRVSLEMELSFKVPEEFEVEHRSLLSTHTSSHAPVEYSTLCIVRVRNTIHS